MPARSAINRFAFERKLLSEGVTLIAGVDEAGRGPLAGPVVAAAVILPRRWLENGLPRRLKGLNDSKQLTVAQREDFFCVLMAEPALSYGVGCLDAALVDEINILRATHRAMADALRQLQPAPQHVLVDGLPVNVLSLPQTALVEGDARSYSIAAASVIAKVSRDRMMVDYHDEWPAYGFAEHKGYGTPRHLAALAEYGPCPIHRRTFSPMKQPDLLED